MRGRLGPASGLRCAYCSAFSCRAQATSVPQRRKPSDLSGIGPSPWPDLPLEEIYGKARRKQAPHNSSISTHGFQAYLPRHQAEAAAVLTAATEAFKPNIAKACRLRQHVNPLRVEHQVPREAPEWASVYAAADLPLVLDIGCAGGRFALAMARRLPDRNFLGLDIRRPLIDRANEWAQELGLTDRAFFAQANATVSLESMLKTYPGRLELATVQFPDPHFKKRHKKRRIVQPQLIDALASLMQPGGQVFLQSDVEEVTAAMRDEFEDHGSRHFDLASTHERSSSNSDGLQPGTRQPQREGPRNAGHVNSGLGPSDPGIPGSEGRSLQPWSDGGYLASNPFGIPTEREVQTTKQNDPVYRVLLTRRC